MPNPYDMPVNAQQNQPAPAPTQAPPVAVPGLTNSDAVPANKGGREADEKSPIDKFSDVFDTTSTDSETNSDKSKSKATNKDEDEELNYSSQIPDQDAFNKTYANSQSLDPNDETFKDLSAKVLKDGDAGALSELLNYNNRNVIATAVAHALKGSGVLMDRNLGKMQKQTGSKVTTGIRVAGLQGQLLGQYPTLKNIPKDYLEQTISKFVTKRGTKSDSELLSDISEWAIHSFNIPKEDPKAKSKTEAEESDEGEDWTDVL